MFCLNPFLKSRNVSRPFWKTDSGCYGSLHCPFPNCGNHRNKSSHSCWCTTPMTLANAPRKRRKDHKNEQDWTIWVHTMAFCKRAGRPQILSQSLFMCILQKQSPWTQTLGLTDLSGKLMQLQHLASLFILWWPRVADMFTVHEKCVPKQKKSKGKFCFYAAWPWLGVVAEEGEAARAWQQDQLTFWEQEVQQPGRHIYEMSQCSYHFLGRDELQNRSQPRSVETLHHAGCDSALQKPLLHIQMRHVFNTQYCFVHIIQCKPTAFYFSVTR